MKDKALKLALETLEQTLQTLDDENAKPGGAIADTIWHSEHETLFDYLGSEITAIKEALAQPAQEPVAWLEPEWGEKICPEVGYEVTMTDDHPRDLCWIPLVAQRPWVGLTDEERDRFVYIDAKDKKRFRKYGAEIEQLLKEKNT